MRKCFLNGECDVKFLGKEGLGEGPRAGFGGWLLSHLFMRGPTAGVPSFWFWRETDVHMSAVVFGKVLMLKSVVI